MKNDRRQFFKLAGLAGLGIISSRVLPANAASENNNGNVRPDQFEPMLNKNRFNMCNYAAPRLQTVRLGFIGLGNRGPVHSTQTSRLEGVEIKAMCDLRPEKVEAARKQVESFGHKPDIYSGKADAWKKVCDRDDIDAIYIATHWELHTPIAVYAMNRGKHVFIEVPAAKTIEECWQLVETSERTRKHCMMLENACYLFWDLLILNMVRQGFFGEIIHTEGAYIHDLLEYNFDKNNLWDVWRLRENTKRNGNLYPTHGLGPICQVLDINRGDKMDYLVSLSSNDFMMGEMAKELAAKDDFYKPFLNQHWRGNMNTTSIKTMKGRSIMLQHDVSSPRVKSLINLVSGTKGVAMEYPLPGKIATSHKGWLPEKDLNDLKEKYEPPIIKKIGEMAKQIGGHGGIDFLMNWHIIDCLRNGLPLSQDVYDAALWSSIGPLSEWSVKNRSNSITVPDFTGGWWKTNAPLDLELKKGANTKILDKKAVEGIKEY
jgi:hypothetical protein